MTCMAGTHSASYLPTVINPLIQGQVKFWRLLFLPLLAAVFPFLSMLVINEALVVIAH